MALQLIETNTVQRLSKPGVKSSHGADAGKRHTGRALQGAFHRYPVIATTANITRSACAVCQASCCIFKTRVSPAASHSLLCATTIIVPGRVSGQ